MRYLVKNPPINYTKLICKNTSLKDSEKKIEKAFLLLYLFGSFSTKKLARELLLPIPIVTAIKKECFKLDLWRQDKGIILTDKGIEYFESHYEYNNSKKSKLRLLLESDDYKQDCIKFLSKKNRQLFDSRPIVDVKIDQAKATVETAFKRAILCLINGDIIGKKVICLGDDDFVSIALGLLLKYIFEPKTFIKTRIHVVDKDQRYIKYISSIAKKYDLPIDCEYLNLKKSIPLKHHYYFDTAFMDPPYTIEGASLFLSRGLGMLKKEKGLTIYFSYANKSIQETFVLQKCFQLHNLIIREISPYFNLYEGASLFGNISQLIILETTEQSKVVTPINKVSEKPIYTMQNKNKNKTYGCYQCNKIFSFENESSFKTIEELKIKGCPDCGGQKFNQLINRPLEKSNRNLPTLGRHILADFYGCKSQKLNDVSFIENIMYTAAVKAETTIVTQEFHKFSPWGVSGVIVIQESHLTIHTWPEYGFASIDLFTCGKEVQTSLAFDYLQEQLDCDKIEFSDIYRGYISEIELL